MDYRTLFKGKKITMLGLGVLGRGVNVAKFLAECGAILTITDLKTEKELATSLKQLKKYKNISFVLGKHRLSDFQRAEMVVKSAGVPLDSIYIKEARKNRIPVHMDASLFTKLAPDGIIMIGITGTRGKSTVTHLIHHIFSSASKSSKALPWSGVVYTQGKALENLEKGMVFLGLNHSPAGMVTRKTLSKVFLGGNVRGMATLPLLKKVKAGDVVVMELDSWQLQGFGDDKISPEISVFTTFLPDHMNYYQGNMQKYFNDKANIFKYQKRGDVLIVGAQADKEISARYKGKIKGKKIVVRESNLPKSWHLQIPGAHNRYNTAIAIAVCEALGISEKEIKKSVECFPGVPGRLELVREVRGVKYYNDTTATTPDGNMAALKALAKKKKDIILIAGGNDKGLSYKEMTSLINKTVKGLVLIDGSATKKILQELPKNIQYPIDIVDGMKKAVESARKSAKKGDIVLLSPGATSFGVFKNEFDRGDQFVAEVKKI